MIPVLVVATVVVAGLLVERALVARRVAHRAAHDRLTGLASRMTFERRVDVALARAHRHDFTVAVLVVDVDHLRSVNEALGHASGDRVLVAVADRLRSVVRDEDTLSRLGGDEFTILLEQVADVTASARVAERVIAELGHPVEVDGVPVYVGASVGVAVTTSRRETGADLVRDAATAAQRAKAAGPARYELFESALGDAARRRLSLEAALHQAVDGGELHLTLEPVVRLDTEELVGVEAVATWHHPTDGVVVHRDLLRLAAEAGEPGLVGHWLLEEACRAGRRLLRQRPALFVHVDVPIGLMERGAAYVQDVADVVRDTGIPATSLVLEVDARDLVEHPGVAGEVLGGLRAVGVQLAVAGFGTGLSSLSWLKHLPVSVLKLDPTVLADGQSEVDRAITRSMLQLASALGLRVVAEGVDTRDRHLVLRGLGCGSGQGRWFSEPLAEDALTDRLTGDDWLGGTDLPAAPRQ